MKMEGKRNVFARGHFHVCMLFGIDTMTLRRKFCADQSFTTGTALVVVLGVYLGSKPKQWKRTTSLRDTRYTKSN